MAPETWIVRLTYENDNRDKLVADPGRSAARAAVGRLRATERTILGCIVRGESTGSMAEILNMDPALVLETRDGLMRKINADSTADAVRIALLAGMDRAADCTSLH